jgi:hypothetical protein
LFSCLLGSLCASVQTLHRKEGRSPSAGSKSASTFSTGSAVPSIQKIAARLHDDERTVRVMVVADPQDSSCQGQPPKDELILA